MTNNSIINKARREAQEALRHRGIEPGSLSDKQLIEKLQKEAMKEIDDNEAMGLDDLARALEFPQSV